MKRPAKFSQGILCEIALSVKGACDELLIVDGKRDTVPHAKCQMKKLQTDCLVEV